jgi:MerR family transcriptional regulator, redox-sensitive transcriptional activator SoxR
MTRAKATSSRRGRRRYRPLSSLRASPDWVYAPHEPGLIRSERAGSGHRRYPRPVLRRIAFIVSAQRIGLTLEEIGAELAELPPDQAPSRRDWASLSATWTASIEERIAELERLKLGLTECIGCCLSLDRSRLANPGDRAARSGPGPRDWIGDRPAT